MKIIAVISVVWFAFVAVVATVVDPLLWIGIPVFVVSAMVASLPALVIAIRYRMKVGHWRWVWE